MRLCRSALVGTSIVALALTCPMPAARAQETLEQLVTKLASPDPFTRQQAEVALRNRGRESLASMAHRLENAPRETFLQLEPIVADVLESFLTDYETEAALLYRDTVELATLEAAIERQAPGITDETHARVKNLRESIAERQPKLDGLDALLASSLPVSARAVLKRREYVGSFLLSRYQGALDRAVARAGTSLLAPQDPERFEQRRYVLGPLWYWAVEREAESAEALRPALQEHLRGCFDDLDASPPRLRDLAEDTFFALGDTGLRYLQSRREESPATCDRLIGLLQWRIQPGVHRETSLDFSGYADLDFRERRRHVIRYARTVGQEAIPTLRLIVYDNTREESVRVKLTAAEALAGLGDRSAIRDLSRRQIPELLKIPEISREFFLLKGIQYQEEKKYDLAIQEFEKILEESPFHFEANYRVAFAYLLKKDYESSIHYFSIARRLRPEDTLTLYNLACAYSLAGKIDAAIRTLKASVDAGFDDAAHIEQDPDLDPLREREEFQEILRSLGGA